MAKQPTKREIRKKPPLTSYEHIQAQNQEAFLNSYRATLNISTSCVVAGISYAVYKRWLLNDPDFQKKIKIAHEVAINTLYAVGYERATIGVKKPLVSHGKLVRNSRGEAEYVREYSNTLLLAYLKAHLPDMFGGDNQTAKKTGVSLRESETFLPENMLVLEPSWLEPETLALIERDIHNHEQQARLQHARDAQLTKELQEGDVIDAAGQ